MQFNDAKEEEMNFWATLIKQEILN